MANAKFICNCGHPGILSKEEGGCCFSRQPALDRIPLYDAVYSFKFFGRTEDGYFQNRAAICPADAIAIASIRWMQSIWAAARSAGSGLTIAASGIATASSGDPTRAG